MYRSRPALITAVLCISLALAKEMTEIEVLSTKPTRCTYEHAFDMYGAHCGGLHLKKIPNLKSGIEILDFSDNKLHEITADTFSSYTSIRYLYLSDNQIYLIEENAFDSLTSLQSLDLSRNVIMDPPNSIFQLPSLRKLYLGGNPIFYKSEVEIKHPIQAPLELLDISDCKIKKLPNWGILPQLAVYNISNNPLESLEVSHFAAMCNLGKVDITKSLDKMHVCEVKPTIMWFQDNHIYFQLDDYTKLNSREFEHCPIIQDSSVNLNATYHRCKSEFLQVKNIRTSRRTWLTIGGGLFGFLVGFILLLYVMHRRNVAQTKKFSQKLKKNIPENCEKHASATLLNDVS